MNHSSYYLLDTENIGVSVFSKLIKSGLKIKNNSALILLFNKKVSYDIEEFKYLSSVFKDIIIEEIEHKTANALDFYLVSSITLLASKHNKKSFFIVSNDKGYMPTIEFLKTYLPTNKYQQISESKSQTPTLTSSTKSPSVGIVKINEVAKIRQNMVDSLFVGSKNSWNKKLNQSIIDDVTPMFSVSRDVKKTAIAPKTFANNFVQLFIHSKNSNDFKNRIKKFTIKYKIEDITSADIESNIINAYLKLNGNVA